MGTPEKTILNGFFARPRHPFYLDSCSTHGLQYRGSIVDGIHKHFQQSSRLLLCLRHDLWHCISVLHLGSRDQYDQEQTRNVHHQKQALTAPTASAGRAPSAGRAGPAGIGALTEGVNHERRTLADLPHCNGKLTAIASDKPTSLLRSGTTRLGENLTVGGPSQPMLDCVVRRAYRSACMGRSAEAP